jgi:Domain of unknown function (DUF4124)
MNCLMRIVPVLLVLALWAVPGVAETCKYVDQDGRTIYSNVPIKNARKITCFQPPQPVAAETPASAPRSATSSGGPDRARIDPTTQRKRDDERRQILEEELSREQAALTEARRALSEQEAVRSGDERNYERVQQRLKPYQDAVETHQKNIASIKREIASLH